MKRLPDWKVRLTDYLVKAASMPFQPGKNDCALFAAGAVEAQTGCDYADEFRGHYTTLRTGLRAVKRAGYSDHIALARAILPTRHMAQVRPGDLAVVEEAGEQALGVVQGEMIYLVSDHGLSLRPLFDAREFLGVG